MKTIKLIEELPYPKKLSFKRGRKQFYVCESCFELVKNYIINRIKNGK
jgi:hypothetical protein